VRVAVSPVILESWEVQASPDQTLDQHLDLN